MLLSKELYEKCKSAYEDWPDLFQMMEHDNRNALSFMRKIVEYNNEATGISYDVILNAKTIEELKELAQKEQNLIRLREETLEECFNEYVQLYGQGEAEYLLCYGDYLT